MEGCWTRDILAENLLEENYKVKHMNTLRVVLEKIEVYQSQYPKDSADRSSQSVAIIDNHEDAPQWTSAQLFKPYQQNRSRKR